MKAEYQNRAQLEGRRNFLKLAAMGAIPLAGKTQLSAENVKSTEKVPSYIKVKRRPEDQGWKYIKVKTMQSQYPAREDDQEFIPSLYGGNTHIQLEKTNYFYVDMVDGRWTLVDPLGHPMFSVGLNTIRPHATVSSEKKNQDAGGEKQWSGDTVELLRKNGFNTAGYWSTAAHQFAPLRHEEIAYVYYGFGEPEDGTDTRVGSIGLMSSFASKLGIHNGRHPYFHVDFPDFCKDRCSKLEAVKDDPWLIGYYTDNELRIPPLEYALRIAPTDANYHGLAEAAKNWAARHDINVNKISQKDNELWIAHVFDWYLEHTCRAIREQDQNHLILGSRFFSSELKMPKVLEIAGKYLDVISLNPYGLEQLTAGTLRKWSTWANNKPVMIGEFYIKAMDTNLNNTKGAGKVVESQIERGLFYQDYVLTLLESKVCVGWHWHRYSDTEAKDGELEGGVNRGVMTADLKPYNALLDSAAEINRKLHTVIDQMG